MYDNWSEKRWLSIHISVTSLQAALQQAGSFFYESGELLLWKWKQTDGSGWLDSAFVVTWLQKWPERLSITTHFIEFLRKNVSNFCFSERNRRRLFIFPRGEGAEFLSFREPSTLYLSNRGRRIFIFLRTVDFLLLGQKEPSTIYFSDRRRLRLYIFQLFFEQKKPSTFYFSTSLSNRRSHRLSIFPKPEAVEFYFVTISQFRIENCSFGVLLLFILACIRWLITE